MSTTPHRKIRCRQIGEADMAAVVDLLVEGFPGRPKDYWLRGLARLADRPVPAGCPRYGHGLESDGALVGVILMLCASGGEGEPPPIRCNMSSWYVQPAFRTYASFLSAAAMKRKEITYTNISPARHTWSNVEALGFIPYCNGLFFTVPSLSPAVTGVRVQEIRAASFVEADRGLLLAHTDYGCLSLVCSGPTGQFPFVFLPFRMRQGRIPLPCMHLVYCRDIADFVRFAGPLGRFLLRRGMPVVLVDACGPIAGLTGKYSEARGRKYFRGPIEPRLGDLAYSELVVFGP